jgi:hypothetical protein
MVWRALILVFVASFLARAEDSDPPPALTCPAGAPLGAVELRVKSPASSETLPLLLEGSSAGRKRPSRRRGRERMA